MSVKVLGLTLMTLFLISCGKNPNGTSVTSGHTLYEPLGRWDKKEIKICLGDYSHLRQTRISESLLSHIRSNEVLTPSAEDFTLVKETITKEYDQNEVGMKFTGWEKCQNLTNEVVLVFINSTDSPYSGTASLGQNMKFEVNKDFELSAVLDEGQRNGYIILNLNSINNKGDLRSLMFKWNAIHEFGHTLGLRHEHARDESYTDPLLPADDFLRESVGLTAKMTGKYDPYSVMSYQLTWYIVLKGNKFDGSKLKLDPRVFQSVPKFWNKDNAEYVPRLSTGDVHTLRCMYVYSDKEKSEKCQ